MVMSLSWQCRRHGDVVVMVTGQVRHQSPLTTVSFTNASSWVNLRLNTASASFLPMENLNLWS